MMTFEVMEHIVNTEIPFNDLMKNEGIFEFHGNDDISFGISSEDDDNGNMRYVYNLFANVHEYINISETGSLEQPINRLIIDEMVKAYNSLI